MLWIGLHLPWLPLESFAATLPPGARDEPLVLLDAHSIAFANVAAQQLGVAPGQKRATALALAPQLRIGQADAARDRQALASVAHVALSFTPAVTLSPPRTVLLEVEASLRCFGGQARLQQRLRSALAPLSHHICLASAPTALGAGLLARGALSQSLGRQRLGSGPAAQATHCADLAALRQALDGAPVWLLDAGREHWDALQGMGLRTLSDLRHLPRAGLARRFGAALLDELDRARGERPDPRDWVRLPPAFEARLELFARADTTEQVLHGAGELLARLIAWVSAQHARVRRFTLVMRHEPRHGNVEPAQTDFDIALAEPSRDAAHLQLLLRERLARTALPAPTLELHLRCADIARGAPPNSELFPAPHSEREGLTRLVERLQARLGTAQVRRLVRVADHRPEYGSSMQEMQQQTLEPACMTAPGRPRRRLPRQGSPAPGARPDAERLQADDVRRPPPERDKETSGGPAFPSERVGPKGWTPRPVWLLAEPLPLRERDHTPLLDGAPLQLLCGPERIEAGWWDGALAERDYFIAQNAAGALVWLFRGRLPLADSGQGWYLQGRFG